VLTPGQAHDVQGFRPLMRLVADRIDALLADKGYDADAVREELAGARIEAVILAKANRRNPAPHDRAKYRRRNRIERLFNKMKNWRRIATRYDRSPAHTSASPPSPQLCSGWPLPTWPSRLARSHAAEKNGTR